MNDQQPTFWRSPFAWSLRHPWRAVFGAFLLANAAFWLPLKWVEYSGRRALAKAIAETEAITPHWQWHQLEADRPELKDEENSALVIAKVFQLKQAGESGLIATDRDNFLKATSRIRYGRDSNHRLNESDVNAIRVAMIVQQAALATAMELKRLPRGHWDISLAADVYSTDIVSIAPVRDVARLVTADCERSLADNDSGEAIERIEVLFNIGNSVRDEPILVSQFVYAAVWAMTYAELQSVFALSVLSSRQLDDLGSIINRNDDPSLFVRMVESDRAMSHIFFAKCESQGIDAKLTRMFGANLQTDVHAWLYWYLLFDDHACMIKKSNQWLLEARKPQSPTLEQARRWEQDLEKTIRHGPLVYRNLISGTLVPSPRALAEHALAERAKIACARVAIAAERFRLQHDRWPSSLDELRIEFLSESPIDPFSQSPLHWAKHDEGIVIYSVGPDGVDNGGEAFNTDQESYDIVFWLFDPDKRGLPPLPPELESNSDGNTSP